MSPDRNKDVSKSTIRIDCQTCLAPTKHEVLEMFSETTSTEDETIEFYDDYQIIRCCGCGHVSFRHASASSEDEDPETGDPLFRAEVYPYRLSGRKKMDGLWSLPEKVRRVYEETHMTLAANAPILGTIGIRAVVEAVCNDKKAKGTTLEEKIENLAKDGWLSSVQAQFLHKSRLLGNVAVHEIVPPESAVLQTALTIVENLLQTVYVLPDVSKSITIGDSKDMA